MYNEDAILTSLGTMRRSNTTIPWGWMLSDVSRFVRVRSTVVRLPGWGWGGNKGRNEDMRTL